MGYDELLSNFDVCTLQTRQLEHKLCTMFKIVRNLTSFPSIFVPHHTSNLLLTQTLSNIALFLAVFHCGNHYQVMSLAHLHLLFLKHMYVSALIAWFVSLYISLC